MTGGGEMEDDDDDDIDFNPYLRPSPDRESDDSSKRGDSEDGEDAEDGQEDEAVERQGNTNAESDSAHLLSRKSGIFGRGHEGNERFWDVTSDDEEEFDGADADVDVEAGLEADAEQMSFDTGVEDRSKSGISTKHSFDRENGEHPSAGFTGVSTDQNLDSFRELLDERRYSISSGNMMFGSEDEMQNLESQARGNLGDERSKGEGDDLKDAISKRTRAQYSLTDLSLDQLETFLQESDEEDYFHTVDDEQEYRKFLLSVQVSEDPTENEPEQSGRKEDEDDEEDVDFEVEIEEALVESDDTTESQRARNRRRPETRKNRRQKAQHQNKGGRATVPLRHLLPHVGNASDTLSILERRRAMSERLNMGWPPQFQEKAPVYGFTAHQIGQLYCLIHEHVQLLIQVVSLCILEPSRQQIAMDTQRLLMEMVEKRELLLSWKKTAFPDFCFRSPYIHPSLVEGHEHTTCFQNLTADAASGLTSAPGGQISGSVLSKTSYGAHFVPGYGTGSTETAWVHHSDHHNSALFRPPSHSLPRMLDSAHAFSMTDHRSGQQAAGGLQPWQETARPFPAWVPDPTSSSAGGYPSFGACSSYDHMYNSQRVGTMPSTTMGQIGTVHEHMRTGKPPGVYPSEQVKFEWAPFTSGPVMSLLDVAPLALVREFLTDVSQVVEDYRQRHVANGDYHMQCEREPLFPVSFADEREQTGEGNFLIERTRSGVAANAGHPQVKRTMAAVLVESTRKQSLALVPKDVAMAVQRFLPYLNKEFFPHKPPPVATANRLLFTDAEDELLAMGLMLYNNEWKAIQQRYLPSKSEHQIFVRQKNRSSARAPENSIKAVRRMKSSPLTPSERSCIQEGLGKFKHDWIKVWQYCVPHRDPALIARQWRVAVGTQKSYKTNETSKEKRRLYEASRRKRIKMATENAGLEENGQIAEAATAGPIDESEDPLEATPSNGVLDENGHSSCAGAIVRDADDPESEYIREAFVDDWCPRGTLAPAEPVVTATTATKQKKPSNSKRRKATKADTELRSSSTPWLDAQKFQITGPNSKQTVKLAPGLPSVKLPPCVQVLSQSQAPPQHSFSVAAGLVPPFNTQWTPTPMTSQALDQLELAVQATHSQSLSIANRAAADAARLNVVGSAPTQLSIPASRSVGGQAQKVSAKKGPSSTRTPKELQERQNVSRVKAPKPVRKRSQKAQKTTATNNQGYPSSLEPSGALISPNNFVSGSQPPTDCTPAVPLHSTTEDHPPGSTELSGCGLSSNTRANNHLVSQTTEEMAVAAILSADGFGSDFQDSVVASSPAASLSLLAEAGHRHVLLTDAAAAGGSRESPLKVASPCAALAPPPVADVHNSQGPSEREPDVPMDSTKVSSSGKKKAGKGEGKPRRSYTKRSKTPACRKNAEKAPSSGKKGNPRSLPTSEPLLNPVPDPGPDGIGVPLTSSRRRHRAAAGGISRTTPGKSRSKKGQKAVQDALIEQGDGELRLDELSIVMEQEELSDSEEEDVVGANVEFEQEEMGDSDRDEGDC